MSRSPLTSAIRAEDGKAVKTTTSSPSTTHPIRPERRKRRNKNLIKTCQLRFYSSNSVKYCTTTCYVATSHWRRHLFHQLNMSWMCHYIGNGPTPLLHWLLVLPSILATTLGWCGGRTVGHHRESLGNTQATRRMMTTTITANASDRIHSRMSAIHRSWCTTIRSH